MSSKSGKTKGRTVASTSAKGKGGVKGKKRASEAAMKVVIVGKYQTEGRDNYIGIRGGRFVRPIPSVEDPTWEAGTFNVGSTYRLNTRKEQPETAFREDVVVATQFDVVREGDETAVRDALDGFKLAESFAFNALCGFTNEGYVPMSEMRESVGVVMSGDQNCGGDAIMELRVLKLGQHRLDVWAEEVECYDDYCETCCVVSPLACVLNLSGRGLAEVVGVGIVDVSAALIPGSTCGTNTRMIERNIGREAAAVETARDFGQIYFSCTFMFGSSSQLNGCQTRTNLNCYFYKKALGPKK